MSTQNLYQANWFKAQGSNFAATGQISFNRSVLHAIVVNSHTSGSWILADGTATSNTKIQGTYSPATGSSTIPMYELEFTNGIYIQTAGTLNATAIYNDL